jgi:hypothetical protein
MGRRLITVKRMSVNRSVEKPIEIGQVVTAPCSRGSVSGGVELEVFQHHGWAEGAQALLVRCGRVFVVIVGRGPMWFLSALISPCFAPEEIRINAAAAITPSPHLSCWK